MNEPTLSGGDGDVNQLFCFCGGGKRCAVRRKSPPGRASCTESFTAQYLTEWTYSVRHSVPYVVECNFMNSMMFGH